MTATFGSPEALQVFVEETRSRLRSIHPLRLLGAPGSAKLDSERLNHVFRQIHSLKSAANLLGLKNIELLCHAFEEILAGYRDGEMTPGAESETELEPTLEIIGRLIDNIRVIRAIDVSREIARLEEIAMARRGGR